MSKINEIKTEEVKVFKQFKKQQILKQVSFVFVALIAGLGINTFILDGDIGTNLKTNIIESTNTNIEKKSNIYIEKVSGKKENLMNLKSGENMDKLKTISFSFAYNPEEVEIQDFFPNINTSRLENEKGITTFIINFKEEKSIKIGEDIISFISYKENETTQHINIINANFTDSNNINYELTTSGIIF